MLRYVLILAALLPAILAATNGITTCTGNTPVTDVDIVGCAQTPCQMQQNTNAVMHVPFTAATEITSFQPKVRAIVAGIGIDYPLTGDVTVGCNYLLHGSQCPISAGEDVEYEFLFFISPTYPAISLTVQLSLVDSNSNTIRCVNVPAQVVS